MEHFASRHKEDIDLLSRKIEDHELTVKCTFCDKGFLEERFMEVHRRLQHTTSYSKGYKKEHGRPTTTHCKLCDVKFENNLEFHKHKHHYHKMEYHLFNQTETICYLV